MAQSRLMSKPEDYRQLELTPGKVAMWEDGKRDDDRRGVVEWWYFDAILDDGSKIAAVYSTKIQPFMFMKGTHPCIKFDLTTPDGRQISKKSLNFQTMRLAFLRKNVTCVGGIITLREI